MLRFRLLIVFTALMSISASETLLWGQSTLSGSRLPSRRLLDRYGLEMMWWNQATLNPTRETVRYLVADEQVAFVQSTGGVVTAFDVENGRVLWARQLGRADEPSYPLTTNDEMVMVNTGMSLYALSKFSGDVQWTLRLPTYPSTQPVTDADNIYVGSLEGSMFAIDLRKVRELYEENRLPEWSHQAIRWRYQTGREITTPPVVSERAVNFASSDSSLYSVTRLERQLVFQLETDAPITASLGWLRRRDPENPETVITLIYLASEDSTLYCLHSGAGTIMWDRQYGLPIRTGPVVVGGNLYVMPVRGGMHCLEAENGEPVWWRPRITEFVASSYQVVYASDELDNLILLSRENGAILGALPMRQFPVRLVNNRTDRIYMSTSSGLLICLREKGREFPIYHKFPENRPILPEFAPVGGDQDEAEKPPEPAVNP